MSENNYKWALKHIGNHIVINSICEIGSRDAIDAIYLSNYYNKKINIFEPDPHNILQVKNNIIKSGKIDQLFLHEHALSDKNTEIDFYAVDPIKYSNTGCSSFYEINFQNRYINDPDRNIKTVQNKIKIKTSRFDSLLLETPDLIAMDVQGAELLVLKGFGEKLNNVKVIILEASLSENYHGGVLFGELNDYLLKYNFKYIVSDRFKHKKPKKKIINSIFSMYEPDFNCLYINEKFL